MRNLVVYDIDELQKGFYKLASQERSFEAWVIDRLHNVFNIPVEPEPCIREQYLLEKMNTLQSIDYHIWKTFKLSQQLHHLRPLTLTKVKRIGRYLLLSFE